jgi:hypothetical protein
MANATTGSVIYVDTTAYQGVGKVYITAIKYIGSASGTAEIKTGNASGTSIWAESGTTNVFNGELEIVADDIHVILANGAKVYIYLARR